MFIKISLSRFFFFFLGLNLKIFLSITDTALGLLYRDKSLLRFGPACFQLLAKMPSAFKSGHPMAILEGLIYLCMPNKIYMLPSFKN